jgi:hypothetical protein
VPGIARAGIALTLLAVLGWAGSLAVDLARAEGPLREASAEMGSWEFRGVQPEAGTWQSALERLDRSAAIVPTNPTMHELRGLLGSMRADSAGEMTAGTAHIVRSLELRPVSPYAWANLAEAKYRLGEPAANLQLAIARAVALGPAEPGVQRTIANYGLAIWDEVDPSTQAAIDRLVGAGFRRNPLEMLRISERRGRLGVACRHLNSLARTPDARVVEKCQSREAPQ